MTETLTKREAVYDAEIAPLMRRIIEVCQANDIPMVFSAQINDDRDGDTDTNEDGDAIGPYYCTTILASSESSGAFAHTGKKILRAAKAVEPDPPPSFAAYAIPKGGAAIRMGGSDDGYDPLGGGG